MTSTGIFSSGMPTIASAKIGFPPIAYTSESALVAAMRPKSYGSSTMGVKKSVVATIACSSFRRYTAASSLDSMPTSRSFGSPRIGVLREDLGKNRGRDLAAAAASVGKLRQADEFGGSVHG